MNNKLLLQDLTDQLADAGKLKKKDAEEFLRAFFKVAEDGLFEDGILKISGLGTLKLVLVEARKSVNVSTGEEFEIREHYKVSFIPDTDLKNAVNQPYAHLEPVELDGVIESPTTTAKEKPTKTTISKEAMTPSENASDPKGPRKIKRSTILWILFFVLIAVLGIWSWLSNDQRRRENAVKINEIELIDSLEADATLQQDLDALAEESDSTGNSAADDSLEAVVQSVAQESGSAAPAVNQKPAAPAAKTATEPTRQATPIAKTAAPIAKPAATIAKTAAPITKPASPNAKSTAPLAKPAASTAKSTAPPVKQAPPTALQKMAVAPKKPTVKEATPVTKTTAPVTKPTEVKTPATTAKPVSPVTKPASGDLATVVMSPGNRLTLLALKYYGHKAFWVYIYQANKSVINNPDNIPTGTTIRIPKPDPKIIDAQNPALVAKAKALQLQILGQK
jgi:nucleoid DNA-binding protein/nucleoid-associated protein YgaU